MDERIVAAYIALSTEARLVADSVILELFTKEEQVRKLAEAITDGKMVSGSNYG